MKSHDRSLIMRFCFPSSKQRDARNPRQGFTLVELLVSMTIVAVLMLMVSSVLGYVQSGWRQASARVSQFREARRAFDRITTTLAQATLNNYLAYRFNNAANPLLPPADMKVSYPQGYVRYSDLQFVCGPSSSNNKPKLTGLDAAVSPGHAVFFQAPIGDDMSLGSTVYRLPTALRGLGFFVRFGDDSAFRPDFLTTRGKPPTYRYRLHEYRCPTEGNIIYDQTTRGTQSDWYGNWETWSRPVANNIILLLISPRRPVDAGSTAKAYDIAPDFKYDTFPEGGLASVKQESEQKFTDFQLPPLVEVTMVAVDEGSAENLALDSGSGTSPHLEDVFESSWFTDASREREDLVALQEALVAKKVNFRVFSATVPIRASRWSRGS